MIFQSSYAKRNDADLVAMVAEGNERAFGELLNRHQNAVYCFARRMLGDPREAEDIAQETFLRLYKFSRTYQPKATLRTYLLRITKNLCIDYFRKKRPELLEEFPEIPNETTPLELLEEAIDADRLEKAIESLPINQRTAVLLRHTEQLSYNQVADVMDITLSAAESLLGRARRSLRNTLKTSP